MAERIQPIGHGIFRARIRSYRTRCKLARLRDITVREDNVYFPEYLCRFVERAMKPAKRSRKNAPMPVWVGVQERMAI
jgi:hypothetical protein